MPALAVSTDPEIDKFHRANTSHEKVTAVVLLPTDFTSSKTRESTQEQLLFGVGS